MRPGKKIVHHEKREAIHLQTHKIVTGGDRIGICFPENRHDHEEAIQDGRVSLTEAEVASLGGQQMISTAFPGVI
jgi:hypothetical protein